MGASAAGSGSVFVSGAGRRAVGLRCGAGSARSAAVGRRILPTQAARPSLRTVPAAAPMRRERLATYLPGFTARYFSGLGRMATSRAAWARVTLSALTPK